VTRGGKSCRSVGVYGRSIGSCTIESRRPGESQRRMPMIPWQHRNTVPPSCT